MKKLLVFGCILLFICCASKRSTVQTEGLEEVIVFGEEESESVSTEPVLPQPEEEEVAAPPIEEPAPQPEEEILPPPPIEEEPILPPPPVEEEPILPPPIPEEEIVSPPLPVEEEIVYAPTIEEESVMPPPVVEEPAYVPAPSMEPSPPPSVKPAKVIGFRVQIFASSTETNASKVANDARTVFNEDVYVGYIAPYYKVRVGDCLTRQDAEMLKNRALNKGYRGAFVVETMITP
jgi:hypothetical protein